MAYRLRPARKSDEPAIWTATMETVWADVPEDERAGLDRPVFEASFREYAAEFVEGRRGERFVAEDDAGRLLGYIILGELRPFFSPKAVGFVYDLWVSPDHRRSGVARFLLAEADRWARSHGYGKIKLEVAEPNLGARALYQNAGYAPERVYMGKRLG
jgi:ribosomal protein S18 acetylase RimI-like enzyme